MLPLINACFRQVTYTHVNSNYMLIPNDTCFLKVIHVYSSALLFKHCNDRTMTITVIYKVLFQNQFAFAGAMETNGVSKKQCHVPCQHITTKQRTYPVGSLFFRTL